ncbi:peptidase M15 family protein [Rhodonellum psychrophilum GCM71 = DSM 17998]|uniref:Peptidase M15 family protein n=2 Tax=Rhodonellum TaxID=336827 RepID=U5BWW8_9BACT|nr:MULTISPECIES: D-Ala-D-Ala carboxypeptidase family metallohydrolase [Rhodonellum]ERM82333.1 peptidase M15 family protein [Rhodonellum psychrophilum GCM71 = DSM 17998]SDZ35469.1 Peptidase M15 [Rhodonellum ikkaensis]
MKLTDNFFVSEVTCKCGCVLPDDIKANLKKVAKNLEVIRAEIGNKVLNINSGYRCLKHNTKVGGAKASKHMQGIATDIRCKTITPIELAKIIERLMDAGKISKGGIGVYKTFVHYDIRGYKVKF